MTQSRPVAQTSSVTTTNRAHWDALADVHARTPTSYYDLDAVRAGASTLSRVERLGIAEAVGDVAGLDVLHLQCHLAMDAISMARAGARVTGADFSPVALDGARALAADCGVDLELVEADSTSLPESLHARFDLVYATIGILTWIEDLDAWMTSARRALRPGGRLLLIDVHPLFAMFASTDPPVADFPYAASGPVRFDEPGSYADQDAEVAATASVEFAHSLGEVVTAATRSGLRLLALTEHLECDVDPRGVLHADDDGTFRLRLGGLPVPLLYTLLAVADGEAPGAG